MSFCSGVRSQTAKSTPTNGCCMRAETYGLLLFSHLLEENKMRCNIEQYETAQLMDGLISACCDVQVCIEEGVSRDGSRTAYSVSIPSVELRDKVLAAYAMTQETADSIDLGIIENDCCREAFIRGTFLVCGSVSDPDKGFHMEFSCRSERLSRQLCALIRENYAVRCNVAARRNGYCVYIKDGDSIEEMLALLGAGDAYFEFVDRRIFSELRNQTNRAKNCDEANISKTIDAAQTQIAAIKRIDRAIGLSNLPPELQQMAALRIEYQHESLRELGEMFDPPLSRSGVNHRMQRLLSYDSAVKEGK